MGTTRYSVISSPIGLLRLESDGAHLTGIYMDHHSGDPGLDAGWQRDDASLAEAAKQLNAYFAGELREFSIPLEPAGSAFQRRVWDALLRIPYGHTETYGQLAARIGHPTASRAVGLATGRNPISIVIPCHRLIGSTGALTGYAGGLDRKRWLLQREGVLLAA